jgi:hypothetical protein
MIVPQSEINRLADIKQQIFYFLETFHKVQLQSLELKERLNMMLDEAQTQKVIDAIDEFSIKMFENGYEYVSTLPELDGEDGQKLLLYTKSLFAAFDDIKNVNNLHHEVFNNISVLKSPLKKFLKPRDVKLVIGLLETFYSELKTLDNEPQKFYFFEPLRLRKDAAPNREMVKRLSQQAFIVGREIKKLNDDAGEILSDEEVKIILGDPGLTIKTIDVVTQAEDIPIRTLKQADITIDINICRLQAVQRILRNRIKEEEDEIKRKSH